MKQPKPYLLDIGRLQLPYWQKEVRQNHESSWILRTDSETKKTFHFASGIYWQSDCIFHRECEVKKVSINRVTHSDHYPVFFELGFDMSAPDLCEQ